MDSAHLQIGAANLGVDPCSPDQSKTCLADARSVIIILKRIRFFHDPDYLAEQLKIIRCLHCYAYHDADNGYIQDIAEFCQVSCLQVLQNFPHDVEVLTELGYNWLQRAQHILTKIHHTDRAGCSYQTTDTDRPLSFEESFELDIVHPHLDPRRQNPLYVEARGILQPAVDFFARAVQSADLQRSTSGDLLAAAGESHISMGTVSAPPEDDIFFTRAIWYLRRAMKVPEYTLPEYLQRYLDDYGRYTPLTTEPRVQNYT